MIWQKVAGLIAVVALCLGFVVPSWAEEGQVQILSPWVSSGEIYKVGPHVLKLVGVAKGMLYIEDKGMDEVDTAAMKCPYVSEIDERTGKSKLQGQCIISTPSGEIVWADIACQGAKGSCSGTFTITGGTGELAGLRGVSPLHIRTAMGALRVDPAQGTAIKDSSGLATMPLLKYTLPEKTR